MWLLEREPYYAQILANSHSVLPCVLAYSTFLLGQTATSRAVQTGHQHADQPCQSTRPKSIVSKPVSLRLKNAACMGAPCRETQTTPTWTYCAPSAKVEGPATPLQLLPARHPHRTWEHLCPAHAVLPQRQGLGGVGTSLCSWSGSCSCPCCGSCCVHGSPCCWCGQARYQQQGCAGSCAPCDGCGQSPPAAAAPDLGPVLRQGCHLAFCASCASCDACAFCVSCASWRPARLGGTACSSRSDRNSSFMLGERHRVVDPPDKHGLCWTMDRQHCAGDVLATQHSAHNSRDRCR